MSLKEFDKILNEFDVYWYVIVIDIEIDIVSAIDILIGIDIYNYVFIRETDVGLSLRPS